MRAPEFWLRDCWQARLLAPAAAFYDLAGRWRARLTMPYTASIPVICVGNLTMGGTGKTPVALAIGAHLHAQRSRVTFLTRGYGGSERGPVMVDARRHDAREIGDEPLLLAALAPTIVARDRAAGARLAANEGAEVIVMDDGLQNSTLAKSLAIVVVDGETGFGNGLVFPAGPLRESVTRGAARADLFIVMGPDRHALTAKLGRHAPVVQARLEPAPAPQLAGARCIAFAGIGRPAKFFATLESLGAQLIERVGFPDHHPYRLDEIETLFARARTAGARVVTTAKDQVRLPSALRNFVDIVTVHAVFEPAAPLFAHIDHVCARRYSREAAGGSRPPRA